MGKILVYNKQAEKVLFNLNRERGLLLAERKIKEGLIKSTCLDWRENFPPNEANFRRNTGCISRKFNEMGRKIFRQDGYGDLFRASLRNVAIIAHVDLVVAKSV